MYFTLRSTELTSVCGLASKTKVTGSQTSAWYLSILHKNASPTPIKFVGKGVSLDLLKSVVNI